MHKILTTLFLASAILPAATVLYNFEDQAATSGASLTSITELVGGVTMTVTRQNSDGFDIQNLGIPASWGHSTLSPFSADDTNAFIFTFSAPISSFSIELGDFGGDSDSEVLMAYSGIGGTGTLLASATGNWGTGSLSTTAPQTDSIAAAGILSVTVIGGSASFPNSLYYDNVTVVTGSAAPEPGSILLTLAGIGALAGGSILRRRSVRA